MLKLTHRHVWDKHQRELADKIDEVVGWINNVENILSELMDGMDVSGMNIKVEPFKGTLPEIKNE